MRSSRTGRATRWRYRDYRLSYIDTAGGGLLADWHYRPLEEAGLSDHTVGSQDLLLTLGAKYQLAGDLALSVNGQLEQAGQAAKDYYGAGSYFTRNLYNLFTANDGGGLVHRVPPGGILDNNTTGLTAWALRGQVNYTHHRGRHDISAIAGGELRQVHNKAQAGRVYGYDPNTITFAGVDYVTAYPYWDNLGYNAVPGNISFSDVLNRFVSAYANAAYTYDGRYTVSGSLRKDASNLFGVNTNQKGVPLWSAGLAWKAAPSLRWRLTYGKNGNVIPGLAALPTIAYYPPNYHTNVPYADVNTLSNAGLRWERTAMLNTGVDISDRNKKLTASVEYFHKRSVDVIALSPVDPTLGLALESSNTANITGDGIDLKLNGVLAAGPVRWESMLLASYVRNRVARYLLSTDNKGSYAGFGYTITPIEGQDPYALISYRWGGLDHATGNPVGFVAGQKVPIMPPSSIHPIGRTSW